MKNNKGFTITELLVIVAIMLSILGIAVYAYSKISEKQKLEARKQVYEQVEGAAEQYFGTNEYLKLDLTGDKYAYVSVGTLVANDYMSVVTDPVTGKQLDNCTIVKVSNTEVGLEYNVLTDENEVEEAKKILGNNKSCKYEPLVIDPKLTRLTVNIYEAKKGCAKGDLLDWKTFLGTTIGEKWSANKGGWFNTTNAPYGLVVEFVTSDKTSVNYSLNGETFKTAKNKERICITEDKKGISLNTKFGNDIDSETTLNLDKTNPLCSLNASGKNGANGWFTSDINITFKSKSDNLNVISSYGLSSTTYNSTNNANNLILASDTKAQSYYGAVKDEAGNIGKCSTIVKRDSKGPSCEIKTSGSYGNNVNGLQWYRSNVNLTLTCNDSISGVSSKGLAASTYTYNNLTTGTQSNETAKVTWGGIAKDNAGNEAKVSYAFGVDKTGPSCTITTTGTKGNVVDGLQWYKSNVGLTLNCSDSASGVFQTGLAASAYTYNNLKTGTQSNETAKVTWGGIAKDNAGNEVKVKSLFGVDKTAPICSILRSGTAGSSVNGVQWYRSNVDLTLSCNEALSGVAAQGLAAGTYAYNNLKTGTQSAETSSVTWGGVAKDKAGNEAKVSSTFGIDKVAPTCSISRSGTAGNYNGVQWYKSNVGLTLNYSDDRSGVVSKGLAASTYTYNGLYSGTQTSETAGVTWGGIVKDAAGNECKTSSNFGVDKTAPPAPTVALVNNKWVEVSNNTWYNTNIYISGQASSSNPNPISNDNLSGTSYYQISTDNTNWTTWAYDSSSTTYRINWDGITYRYVRAIDKAGNISATTTKIIKRDIVTPTCTLTTTGTKGNKVGSVQWYLSDVSLSLSCNDDRSGINNYGLAASDYKYNGLYSGTQTSETAGVTWGGIAKDNAGNEVKVKSPFALEKSVKITFNHGLSALAKSDSDRTTAKGNLVFNTSKASKLCGFNTCSNINCRTDSAKTTQCNKKYFARSCWNVDTYPRFFNVTAKSFNNGTTTTVFATDASKSSAVIDNVTYYMNNSLVRSQQIFKYGAADNAEKNIKSPYYFNDVGVSQHATWRNDFSAHKYQYTSPAGNKSNQIRLYTEYIADCGYSYK